MADLTSDVDTISRQRKRVGSRCPWGAPHATCPAGQSRRQCWLSNRVVPSLERPVDAHIVTLSASERRRLNSPSVGSTFGHGLCLQYGLVEKFRRIFVETFPELAVFDEKTQGFDVQAVLHWDLETDYGTCNSRFSITSQIPWNTLP